MPCIRVTCPENALHGGEFPRRVRLAPKHAKEQHDV